MLFWDAHAVQTLLLVLYRHSKALTSIIYTGSEYLSSIIAMDYLQPHEKSVGIFGGLCSEWNGDNWLRSCLRIVEQSFVQGFYIFHFYGSDKMQHIYLCAILLSEEEMVGWLHSMVYSWLHREGKSSFWYGAKAYQKISTKYESSPRYNRHYINISG